MVIFLLLSTNPLNDQNLFTIYFSYRLVIRSKNLMLSAAHTEVDSVQNTAALKPFSVIAELNFPIMLYINSF